MIINTQAINIGRLQVIGRSSIFTFEAWQSIFWNMSMVTVTYYVVVHDFYAFV